MITITELSGKQGQTLGHSDWLTIDQNRIDQFADVQDNTLVEGNAYRWEVISFKGDYEWSREIGRYHL